MPLFRRGRHSRPGIPAPVAQTKRPTAAAPASFAGRGAGGGVAPSHARLPRHIPSRGPGPQHLRRAGGAGVARRCPRGRRRRAKGGGPVRPGRRRGLEAALLSPAAAAAVQPGERAWETRCLQVGPICSHPPGSGGCGQPAGAEGQSRYRSYELCGWTPCPAARLQLSLSAPSSRASASQSPGSLHLAEDWGLLPAGAPVFLNTAGVLATQLPTCLSRGQVQIP